MAPAVTMGGCGVGSTRGSSGIEAKDATSHLIMYKRNLHNKVPGTEYASTKTDQAWFNGMQCKNLETSSLWPVSVPTDVGGRGSPVSHLSSPSTRQGPFDLIFTMTLRQES